MQSRPIPTFSRTGPLHQALLRSRRSARLAPPLEPLLERMTVLIRRVELNVAALGALLLKVTEAWVREELVEGAAPSTNEY
jgi:hypothetical protein